jgi:hypothetical protein
MPVKNRLYTVICKWHQVLDGCKSEQTVAVVLWNAFDAMDASNEACLYLMWDKQGQAQPLLVFEGAPALIFRSKEVFDANEYDDTITFARGKIVSCHEFD